MIHLVIGRRENGKTTLAWFMALGCPRLLVFDPRGLIGRDVDRVQSAEEFEIAMPVMVKGERAIVVYTPRGDVEEGFELFAKVAAKWVRDYRDSPIAIVVDEAGFLTRMDRCVDFMWVCRCSKRDTAQIILTAHRPRDIATSVRAIADRWLVFSCRQEHDIKVFDERMTTQAVKTIEKLPVRHFVAWDDAKGEAMLYSRTDRWFVELSATERPQHEEGFGEGSTIDANPGSLFS